ncbi:FecR family protein [Pseudoflavitalea sp. X16]|uniref:FecR family protein n=1 Tax=Paraflavitalea devenefica TaxID=2716334 RepID=UPI0014238162|nr:FecR domain-containing protein [Paraflavitalea devenefica]NII25228.1 FecR family protein [Paraflavitalea devenefica]
MDKGRISYLLQEYAAGRASQNEVEELFELLKSVEHEDVLRNLIVKEGTDNDPGISLPQHKWDEMWMAISTAAATHRPKRVRTMQWVSIAAAILVIVAAGFYFFSGKKERAGEPVTEKSDPQQDVAPGGNKALLTLADGSTIVLDSIQNGLLAQQGNIIVVKLDNGQLAYKPGTQGQLPGTVGYNTIATPRGGQYHVVLPDGSAVWLNASSSLRFPTAFTGQERRIELTGEAYFEVARNKQVPFKVFVPPQPGRLEGTEVEVTGTHFNIMAYPNEESTKTTLLEGSVRVSNQQPASGQQRPAVTLKPGQQAQMDNDKISVVNNVNLDQVIAWKNGLFRFKDTDIKELMRQVERWYDVEVEYQTKRRDQVYTGIVARSENLSSVLQLLELTGTVHFRVQGKKIIVLP